jgi:hypothetical protein
MGDDDRYRTWSDALDALEADVAEVEALLRENHLADDTPRAGPWTPPEGTGPLPIDLAPRAEAILARQVSATQAIALALATNRKLAAAAARVEAGSQGAPRPAYVDYSA